MLVNELGKFVASTRYENLPAEVIEAVKLRVLDSLGAGLAGYHLGCHEKLLPIYNNAGAASVWGTGQKLALRDATLLNSFLAHALYLADGSRYTGGHPSPVVIPSALAMAEVERAAGRDLIAAVAAGYEIFLRVGRTIYPYSVMYGFHSTSLIGGVASAAACANLLRFPAETAKNTLAIACSLGVGLKEAHHCSGSQPIQVARACEAGVVAALFAGQGAAGADSIFEGGFLKVYAESQDTAEILRGLGTDYRIFETYIKVHGGCRGNHAPVDLAQELVKTHGIKPDDIASILIKVDSVTYAAEIHAPVNGEQAQFSVAFAVAVALLNGDASVFQYTDANVADPRIRAMMARIRVEVDPELDKGYPDKRAASIVIVLADGTRHPGYICNAKGEPEYPLSPADIEAKFLTLTRDILPGGGGERVRDLVMGLEKLTDLNVLTAALKARARSSKVAHA